MVSVAKQTKENTTMKKMLKGFTLVEIMIVVAIIAILAAVAIPNFIKYRNESQKSTCISNMKQLQTAGEQWCMVNNATATPPITDLCGSDKYVKTTPVCPYAGEAYTVGNDSGIVTVTCPKATALGHVIPGTAAAATATGT
jgi:type IV pilus assembly protein PilA